MARNLTKKVIDLVRMRRNGQAKNLVPLTFRYCLDDGTTVYPETKMRVSAGLRLGVALPGTILELSVHPYRVESRGIGQDKVELTVDEDVQLLVVTVPEEPGEVVVYYK